MVIAWGEAPGKRASLILLRPVSAEQVPFNSALAFIQRSAVLLGQLAILAFWKSSNDGANVANHLALKNCLLALVFPTAKYTFRISLVTC